MLEQLKKLSSKYNLPIDLQLRLQYKVMAEKYKRDLYSFSRNILGYKDINKHTHGDVIEALSSATKRKLVVMPRGSLKSSLCSVAYPIFCLLRDPNERILLDSELYSNSKNFLREIKMHLETKVMKDIFGSFRADPWNEGEITIAQRTKIYKEASITASGIGAEKTGQHYRLIICDDLNSPNNSSSQEGREKVINHYKYLFSILEPDGTLVLVGTRYAADDVIGFCLRQELGLS